MKASEKKHEEFLNLAMPHASALLRTAKRMIGNEKSAEDLVQECFLRAYRFFDQFQKGTNFKAWIFKILTNLFRNYYRKADSAPKMVDWDSVSAFHGETVESMLAAQEQGSVDFEEVLEDQVKAALEKLPVDYREVVMLAMVESFSYQEISKILNIPMGTVMSRLYRGRQMLKQDLADYAKEMGYLKREDDS